MKDWTAVRSAARRAGVRAQVRRTGRGGDGGDAGEQEGEHRDKASRFVIPLAEKVERTRHSPAFLDWQHLISQIPQLLVSSPASRVSGASRRANLPSLTCERILDAPGLSADPNSNLLDWSDQGVLAVGLCCYAYCWRGGSGEVTSVYGPSENPVRAVAWHRSGVCLGVSSARGRVVLVDAQRGAVTRDLELSQGDINAVSFCQDLMTVADSCGCLTHVDIRMKHCALKQEAHKGGVTRTAWNCDLTRVGSGGGDGTVKLWELRQSGCLCTLQAGCSVRAVAWHPSHRSTLAFAGASVAVYDHCSSSLETASLAQPAGLAWWGALLLCAGGHSIHCLEPKSARTTVVAQMDSKVLQVAGRQTQSLVTATEDETLRFWQVPQECVN